MLQALSAEKALHIYENFWPGGFPTTLITTIIREHKKSLGG
jgi:hypothetical protein